MLESDMSAEDAGSFRQRLTTYLRALLHVEVELSPWDRKGSLKAFVARPYRFYHAQIAGGQCLFMAQRQVEESTPAEVGRDVEAVRATFDGIVVFAAQSMSATMRARLIARGVPFAIPGNQLYIPQLAIALREHFRAAPRRGNYLTPAAQLLLFHHLLHGVEDQPTPTELATRLHYSPMSIGRAFDELASRGLARVERHGREKQIAFDTDRKAIFEASRPLLRSPVRGVHAVRFNRAMPAMPIAGESALAELTNLAPPRLRTFAIPAVQWQTYFESHGIRDLDYEFEGEAIIETWRYDPSRLGHGYHVDPLSLYAQYKDDDDERLAQAAEELLEALPWS
jgi:hypothetical protein